MKRGLIIALAAGAAVLVAGGVAWAVMTRSPSSEDVAQAYLGALAAGDVAAVEALLGERASDQTHQRALDAFADADAFVEDPSLEGVGEDGSARATGQLDGEEVTLFFIVSQTDGRWAVTGDHLAGLTVSTTMGDSVRIADVLVPAGEPVALLPAVYTVHAAPADVLDGTVTVAVTNEEPMTAQVEASLSPDATAIAQEQLDRYAEECAAPAGAVPANCGIAVPWGADLAVLDSLAYRVERTPVLALDADASGFTAAGGVLVATARGTAHDGSAGTATYRTEDWTMRGTVAFTGDRMVVAVR